MKKLLIRTLQTTFLLFLFSSGFGQEATMPLDGSSEFTIEGTSTLHNWSVEAQEVEGQITLGEAFASGNLPEKGTKISQLSVKVAVASMDGGKEVMNGKMHRALLKDTHPFILFDLESADVHATDPTSNSIELEAKGNLSIAGVSQPAVLNVTGKAEAAEWTFTGSYPIKMSDFNIEAPTAMFGQIVTGDEVQVSFKLVTKP
ncbi:MAG: YceI family protein [Bacteroidota bacterium]